MTSSLVNVSVIIPAYNSSDTISQTLNSLLSQNYPNWEAIVIDDGSIDNTAAIVNSFVNIDKRIIVISQENQGVSAARNKGIDIAKYDWLLFLDSDDWIAENHLERMVQTLAADPELDAVNCGWKSIMPDGTLLEENYPPSSTDLFPFFARHCSFIIHSCLIRKEIVVVVGKFDHNLNLCEDWDLWQRVARIGIRFGTIKEVLAYYRLRPNSLSRNKELFHVNALKVLKQGFSYDPRVPKESSKYVNGMDSDQLSMHQFYWTSWCAGLFLGQGEDPRHLLSLFSSKGPLNLDPQWIANNIFDSVVLSTLQAPTSWYILWPSIENILILFLSSLEERSVTVGLANRTLVIIERLIIQHSALKVPLTIGKTHGTRLEVTMPLLDFYPPPATERLYCKITMEEKEIGNIELPICDGLMPAWLFQDAISAKYAWLILGRFFEYNIYKKNYFSEKLEKNSLHELHDKIGWTIFLQQLWGCPQLSVEHFYDPSYKDKKETFIHTDSDSLKIEISDILPNVKVKASIINVACSVGGSVISIFNLPVKNDFISANTLRAFITTEGNYELCRISVREALLGRPLNEQTTLRERLADSAAYHSNKKSAGHAEVEKTSALALISHKTLVLGQRKGKVGENFCRRAILPSSKAWTLYEMAKIVDEPILQYPPEGVKADLVLYLPDVIGRQTVTSSTELNAPPKINESSVYGRHHFETLFSKQPDPWKYTHPYEQTKYEFTLSLLPEYPFKSALEIACAEGHFTEQLAPRVEKLLAADISKIALSRAAERCSHLNNIHFTHLDLFQNKLPGNFDLIVCSEVLYYVGNREKLKTIAGKIAHSLNRGGFLLMAHAHQVIDEPDKPGFDWGLSFGAKVIGEEFSSISSLQLLKEIRTPLYRVQLFQSQIKPMFPWLKKGKPFIKMMDQPTAIPPEVESSVRWQGGKPSFLIDQKSVITTNLPILMYHRVAPSGKKSLSRYRITPEQFEEQLQYLKETGYYSVDWNDWANSILTRKALPGRAIALTFDDGYQDFYQFAWPILKKYGFTASVFLVADNVGHYNSWDNMYGEKIPLMNWNEIFWLKEQGVEFGSHSCTHFPLSGLAPSEIVQEGAKSRMVLHQKLRSSVRLFAYPYGDTDSTVAHLIGACGYSLGFSCKSGLSSFYDDMLMLPRIEVHGSDSIPAFIAKLN